MVLGMLFAFYRYYPSSFPKRLHQFIPHKLCSFPQFHKYGSVVFIVAKLISNVSKVVNVLRNSDERADQPEWEGWGMSETGSSTYL